MRIEHLSDDVTLYLGDSLSILPTLDRIDALVTDPPYSSGGFTESGKKAAKGMGLRSETIRDVGWFDGDAMTSAGAGYLLREVCSWAFRLLPIGGTATVFTDWRMIPHLAPAIEAARFRYQNMVVWNKGAAGLGTGFRAQHELAMHFAKGTPAYNSCSFGNVLTIPRIQAATREHQTEKPVELMRAILEVVSAEGGVVLDPFMGSGSTGVAAVQLGRKFIGVEVEARHFETACRRIDAALSAPSMFVGPRPVEVQEAFL